jgi:hypothetical protein
MPSKLLWAVHLSEQSKKTAIYYPLPNGIALALTAWETSFRTNLAVNTHSSYQKHSSIAPTITSNWSSLLSVQFMPKVKFTHTSNNLQHRRKHNENAGTRRGQTSAQNIN